MNTDDYEGHTEGPLEEGEYTPSDEMIERFQNRELQGAVMQQGSNLMLAMIGLEGNGEKDRLLIADAPLLLAEVKRLRGALAYTASLLTCRIEGDDIPVTDIREYALDVVDMTVNEALATTDLMGDD